MLHAHVQHFFPTWIWHSEVGKNQYKALLLLVWEERKAWLYLQRAPDNFPSALRMADADILPFDFRGLCANIKIYSVELQSLLNNMRETTRINNEVLKGNYLDLAADTARPFFPPKPTKEVPYIDFSPLLNAISMLEKSVEHAHAVWVQARISGGNHEALNQLLYHAEK